MFIVLLAAVASVPAHSADPSLSALLLAERYSEEVVFARYGVREKLDDVRASWDG